MAGIVSNLSRMGGVALFAASTIAMAAQGQDIGSAPSADGASVPAPDDGASNGTPAPTSDPGQPDPGTSPPPQQDAAPAEQPQPSPSLPTDAISSAANPPDDAPTDGGVPATPAPAEPLPPAPDIRVTDSQLLSLQIDDAGAQTVTPATTIPYVVGKSCYSWAIHYAPEAGELILSEELVLPGPARNWNATPPERTKVNPQGSGAVTERHFDASTGTATAGWCIASSDPMGSYRYIIRQGDREVARFDFTVGDLL